ncbi:hypothetical protein H4219_001439 [Mycoemilia scoparia]|uniref:Uncharacterized protein n=1 Tax=Mycoemilia scoparia TaxID=417184 RepID=A0A9W8A3E7_9FUNG|nr:hypothetical protein H4219_001439 [Mycoemilia scoparia]
MEKLQSAAVDPKGWKTSKILADTKLSLAHQNIDEVVLPRSLVPQFMILAKLTLNNNNIRSLPKSIFYLTSLEILDVSHNLLGSDSFSFPAYLIPNLINLRICFLHDNKLTKIPQQFGLLKKLLCLSISKNPITFLPHDITSIKLLQCDDDDLSTSDFGPDNSDGHRSNTPAPLSLSTSSSTESTSERFVSLLDLCTQITISALHKLVESDAGVNDLSPTIMVQDNNSSLHDTLVPAQIHLINQLGEEDFENAINSLSLISPEQISLHRSQSPALGINNSTHILNTAKITSAAISSDRMDQVPLYSRNIRKSLYTKYQNIETMPLDPKLALPMNASMLLSRLNELDYCTICRSPLVPTLQHHFNITIDLGFEYPVIGYCCSKSCQNMFLLKIKQ